MSFTFTFPNATTNFKNMCVFQEHEERIMFLRERHDLEQKISTLQDMLERSGDEEQVDR